MTTDGPVLGIDFGTTNSSMAALNPELGTAEVIKNLEGEEKTPSVVYFGREETLVGRAAVNKLEDEHHDPDVRHRVVHSIKRQLTSSLVALPDRDVTPSDVVAEILGKLKADAETAHFHEPISRLCLAYPAEFGHRERLVLEKAAHDAGFEDVRFIHEPVAAALAFGKMGRGVGSKILVYDLGGGTFDLALVSRVEEHYQVKGEPAGDRQCGGDDFDLALYRHFEARAEERLGHGFTRRREEIDRKILAAYRQWKERLSRESRVSVTHWVEGDPGARFTDEVTAETLDELVRRRISGTIEKTSSMMERGKETGDQVDTLVLIGGSSRLRVVKRGLEEALDLEPMEFHQRDLAVALGTALAGSQRLSTDSPSQAAGDPKSSYRAAVMVAYADGVIQPEEVVQLENLAVTLDLPAAQAAEVEKEVLGATKEEVAKEEPAAELEEPTDLEVPPDLEAPPDLGASIGTLELRSLLDTLSRFSSDKDLLVGPDLPSRRLRTAKRRCRVPEDDMVIGLLDVSFLKNAKRALVISDSGLYFCTDEMGRKRARTGSIPFGEMAARRFRASDRYAVDLDRGQTLDVTACDMSARRVVELLGAITRWTKELRSRRPEPQPSSASRPTTTSPRPSERPGGEAPEKSPEEAQETSGSGQSHDRYPGLFAIFSVARFQTKDLYVTPHIPAAKLRRAVEACEVPDDEEIVAFLDTSLFGSARRGVVFGTRGFYYFNWSGRATGSGSLGYQELTSRNLEATGGKDVALGEGQFVNLGSAGLGQRDFIDILGEIALVVSDLKRTA